MTRVQRMLSPIACVCSLIFTAVAAANPVGPLIAELVEYPDVRLAIPAETDATFRRAVSASPDQAAAAATLLQGARTELARIVNRHLRAVRDDPTFEEIKRSEAQVVQDAATVERELLTDLGATLTEAQQPRFAAFERAHRRSLLRLNPPQPMPIDLWKFFASIGFDPASDTNVAVLLERFDLDSDAALVRQRRAMLAYFDNVRRGADGTPEAQERDRRAQREYFAANANLDRVHAGIVEPLLDALPGDVAEKLVVALLSRALESYDANLVEPARYPVIREVLALGLPAEKKQRVQKIVERATTQARALARTSVVEQARFVLLDDARRTDGRTSPINLYLGEAGKLRKSTSEEALALLTPEERRNYDASEVLDPSPSSAVKDE